MQFRVVPSLEGEHVDALVVPVFKDADVAGATPAELRTTAEWVARESGTQKLFSPVTHLQPLGDGGSTRLVVVAAGKRDEYDLQRARQVVSAGARSLLKSTATRVGVVLETDTLDAQEAVQAAVEGVLYAMWRPDTHRTVEKDRQLPPIEEVLLLAADASAPASGGADGYAAAIERGQIVGDAVNWARSVSQEPANLMTPRHIADAARELAQETGLQVTVLDEDQCARLGMGSFLSVARGSDEPAQLIVFRHHGRSGEGYDLGLVGKGITFDSGGISIKPAQDMYLMKYDMAGAAAVLAAAAAVARLGLPLNLIAVAPCTENLPGGHATKPGDVFTSMSGKTVEVINTDAEGRLVLLDGVSYAQREGATRVVDVATLTGAVIVALGHHYAGLFGRPIGFVDAVRGAGERSGERLWPMPLSDEYRDEMKSEIADLRNSAGRQGGAILGAAFIDAAVEPDTEWVHLDIASTAWLDEDQPYSPKGPSGSSIRTLVELATTIAGR